jgi:hypothetical protein
MLCRCAKSYDQCLCGTLTLEDDDEDDDEDNDEEDNEDDDEGTGSVETATGSSVGMTVDEAVNVCGKSGTTGTELDGTNEDDDDVDIHVLDVDVMKVKYNTVPVFI